MALNQRQVLILGGGGLVAYFLLKKPKPGQPPNALQKALGLGGTTATAPRPSATALGSQGGYYGGGTTGGTPRPTTTNLATQYGNATRPQTPSLQGFGSNPVASLIGGFANLAGSILKGITGQAPRPGTATTAPIAGQQSKAGSGSAPTAGGGSSGGGGGVTRPGSSPSAGQPNIFGGQTTYSGTYNPDDYKGINPNTGLYDPDYDPSVIVAGYFDPVSNEWVPAGGAPPVADYSQLPGYGTPLDENGVVDPYAAPAQGQDTGTGAYMAQGGVSGPDDAGYYYNPDGSIAWGYGEAPAVPDASWDQVNDDPTQSIGSGGDFSDLPGYGIELPQVEPVYVQGYDVDPTTWDAPTDDSFASANDFSSLPGYGTDLGGGGGGDVDLYDNVFGYDESGF